jgi:hypothetical protein
MLYTHASPLGREYVPALPAALAFVVFACSGIVRMAALTLEPVAAIDSEGHAKTLHQLGPHWPTKFRIGHKSLIISWRRGGDSNT